MLTFLIWIYALNATLLVVHEIDSAYWKEWELFHLPGGIGFFLILHLVLVFVILLGIVGVSRNNLAGLTLSLVLSLAGISAFAIHRWFIRRGHQQFKTPVSQGILTALLAVSIVQSGCTVYLVLN
jgi:hypothetical protein